MIQKKICLLGSFSVGKTSLVKRFVDSMFDERYLTTVGVKVDKKQLTVDGTDLSLMIWDLAGEDGYSTIRTTYLRGAAGYILVMDGTRPASFDTAMEVQQLAEEVLGDVPFVTAINKADLVDEWVMTDEQLNGLDDKFDLMRTSAKTGDNVEKLFSRLGEKLL